MKYLKLFFRLLLGLFMTYAGFSHLTFNRQEFVAQVPTWLQFSPDFTDFVVLASGVVEIAFRQMESNRRCAAGTFLCSHFPWQHQPVCEPHRCLRTQYRSGPTYSIVLPTSAYLPCSVDYWRLEVLEALGERKI